MNEISPKLVTKITEEQGKIYKKKVLESKPSEVREILNITKVPFMYGTIGQHRSASTTQVGQKRKKLGRNNSVVLEEIELDKIHGEILSQNISQGISQRNFHSKKNSLPSLNNDIEKTSVGTKPENTQNFRNSHKIRKIKKFRKISKSKNTSIGEYSVTDFKKAYQYVKSQKSTARGMRRQGKKVINLGDNFMFKEVDYDQHFSAKNSKNTTAASIFTSLK